MQHLELTEEWRPILGYETSYEVSSLGRVRSFYRGGRLLKQTFDKDSYARVHLSFNAVAKKKRVCRLVLEAFRGPSTLQCRHLNGDKSDNNLTNLQWGTPLENSNDKRLHGTIPFGEEHGNSLLSNLDVIEIRRRVDKGETQISLAKEKGVSKSTISAIIQGVSWKDI